MDLSKISQSYQLMQHSDKLQVVFVSVDPMRDIGNLDNFASTFNSSFLGLTARQDEMMSISKTLGVYHEVVQSQKLAQEDHSNHGEHSHEVGGDEEHGSTEMAHYDLDHTSSYLLFNPNLELTALLTSPHKVVPMAEALDKIIETLGKD
jgi:protein SCO1/2